MLSSKLLLSKHVNSSLLAILQLLRQLVVAKQHCVSRFQLSLPPVELFAQELTF
jgi:hypothetical protein